MSKTLFSAVGATGGNRPDFAATTRGDHPCCDWRRLLLSRCCDRARSLLSPSSTTRERWSFNNTALRHTPDLFPLSTVGLHGLPPSGRFFENTCQGFLAYASTFLYFYIN